MSIRNDLARFGIARFFDGYRFRPGRSLSIELSQSSLKVWYDQCPKINS